jgi:hypothetical protein
MTSKGVALATSIGYYTSYMSKYHNIKTRTTDGILHDSIKEANRWCELNLLLKAKKISDLQRQVRFELIPKQEGERAVYYIADFVYTENGKRVVEDVKGMKTQAYKIKKKLMLYFHGIKIREI